MNNSGTTISRAPTNQSEPLFWKKGIIDQDQGERVGHRPGLLLSPWMAAFGNLAVGLESGAHQAWVMVCMSENLPHLGVGIKPFTWTHLEGKFLRSLWERAAKWVDQPLEG
jgi:hypothetical protein